MLHVDINTQIITWAISRAGYDPERFLDQNPEARDWVNGKRKPTLKQLRDFSHKVHVPFGYMLLQDPPETDEEAPIPFYRSLSQEHSSPVSLNLRELIRTLQKRQDWLSGYLKEKGQEPLVFVGSHSTGSDIESLASEIRNHLKLPVDWAEQVDSWLEALSVLNERMGEVGIYATFTSVVGNNTHRVIPVEECRGFVLVDRYAPFLFVNASDSKAAQMFTIAHELAHIWVGESAGFDFRELQPSENALEKFCDRVAAELLVPEKAFFEAWERDADLSYLARKFKVSKLVVARRALDLNKMGKEEFLSFYRDHMNRHQQSKSKSSEGGNFYATLKRRLNPRFIAEVNLAVKENRLLHRDAYKLTGLRGETWEKALWELGLL